MTNDEQLEVFAENIVKLRKKNGLEIEQMAGIMKISVEDMRNLERSLFPDDLSVDVIFRIQKHFGIKASKLFMPQEADLIWAVL